MLVGEAPGANEEREGKPFVGGSGVLLDQMLNRSGLRRSECFLTNIAHKQPPGNEFKWFFTKEGQPWLVQGIIQLKKDIETIKPNLVIALGGQALQVLTGKKPISDWRGSILQSTLVSAQKTIGTIHPAAALRIWENKAIIETDLRRCVEESRTAAIVLPNRKFFLPGSVVTLRAGTSWTRINNIYDKGSLVDEMMASQWLAIDIECWQTDSGRWKLACVGFSDRPDRALVLDANDSGDMLFVRALCGCPAQKVMQNGMFDYSVLRDLGIEVTNFTWDTMIAHHTLMAECAGGGDEMAALSGKKSTSVFKKGLAFQTSIYTKEPFYKSDGKLWKESGDIEIFWRYNALDAAVTREIRDVQEREMDSFGVSSLFHKIMPQVFPVMEATRIGIRIDSGVRDQLRQSTEARIVNMQSFVDSVVGENINVKSNPQMVRLLYETLKLPVRRGKSGNPTADADTLVELGGISNNPVLHSIIKLRQERDLVERYLSAPLDADMRMRCSFDLTGTRSGRLSSRASISGSGTNLQNQPEAMRVMFQADPGKAFVYRDYSQAEARIVAYLARCRGLIELFEDPARDVHTENAARIFGHKVAKLEKHGGPVTATQRYLAKRVVHACNYGMGAKRLVEVVNEDTAETGIRIDLKQAKALIEKYFLLYPEIQQNFWKEVERELRYTRTLTTPFGRKRQFFARMDDKLLREAYSYIPQSTCGDLGRFAWQAISDSLGDHPDCGGVVLLNVHDSILVQCGVESVEQVASLMREAMCIEIELNGYKFTIPTDVKVGLNWGNISDTNPDGLKELPE